jgi:putative RecB family exonuclease
MSAAALAVPAAPRVDAGLADVLSPSRVNTYLGCSARFWFKYGLELPDVQGSARAIGKALHSTMRENFAQKMETLKDLPLAGVQAIFKDSWAAEQRETQFTPDEEPDECKAMGLRLVEKYLEETAPLIEPAAVELPVEGIIAGVPVRGFVDVMDRHGRIIDIKSANKTPSKNKIRPDYRFQIATYAAITPKATGKARLDTIVKLKREIKIIPQVFEITPADKRSIETLYPLAQEGMRSGLYLPNRNNFLCSRNYCPYWRECEREFGGQVNGGDDE